jgi:hypothetical protein
MLINFCKTKRNITIAMRLSSSLYTFPNMFQHLVWTKDRQGTMLCAWEKGEKIKNRGQLHTST